MRHAPKRGSLPSFNSLGFLSPPRCPLLPHQAAELARTNNGEGASSAGAQWERTIRGALDQHRTTESPRKSEQPVDEAEGVGSKIGTDLRVGDMGGVQNSSLHMIVKMLGELKQGVATVSERLSAVEQRLLSASAQVAPINDSKVAR